MPYFEDERAVYGHIGYLLRAAVADEDLGARLRAANAVVQYDVRRPNARITANLRQDGDLRVDLGDTELRPDVVLAMDGDTAHAYWQGELNIAVALARGQIKAHGPVAAILRLVPLSRDLFPRYRDLVQGGDLPPLDASLGVAVAGERDGAAAAEDGAAGAGVEQGGEPADAARAAEGAPAADAAPVEEPAAVGEPAPVAQAAAGADVGATDDVAQAAEPAPATRDTPTAEAVAAQAPPPLDETAPDRAGGPREPVVAADATTAPAPAPPVDEAPTEGDPEAGQPGVEAAGTTGSPQDHGAPDAATEAEDPIEPPGEAGAESADAGKPGT